MNFWKKNLVAPKCHDQTLGTTWEGHPRTCKWLVKPLVTPIYGRLERGPTTPVGGDVYDHLIVISLTHVISQVMGRRSDPPSIPVAIQGLRWWWWCLKTDSNPAEMVQVKLPKLNVSTWICRIIGGLGARWNLRIRMGIPISIPGFIEEILGIPNRRDPGSTN